MVTATSSGPVAEARLANGLRILLEEDHSAPVVSFWVWYRVGSRNEVPGKTGISHWTEHMQFKGTPTFAKGQIFRDVSRVGGTLNALTSRDWTAYFETVPSSELDLSLAIESDRMANSLFAPAEVESERTVILSERAGAENNPGYTLYEEVNGAAFRAHPYRHMVIGLESDLRRISRDDLYHHYQRYYHPGNSFIVAVGDFSTEELLSRIEAAFGLIPPGVPSSRTLDVVEPPQLGERRVLLRRPAGAPYLRLAFKTPAATDPDTVPLLVADAVLSGGKPMGFGAGGGMGRSSRLYRALVASGLARGASSAPDLHVDPALFQVAVTALPEGDLGAIEAVIDSELARLQDEPAPAEELQRAIRQLESQLVYGAESVTNRAYWLGLWEIVDTWKRTESLLEEVRAVTASDIQRVARQYFKTDQKTIGWLEPDNPAAGAAASSPADLQGYVAPDAWGLGGPASLAGVTRFERVVLPNGLTILGQDRPRSRSVALRARLPAGSIHEDPAQGGVAYLTARALLRGSAGRTYAELSERLDALGASISIDAGRQFVEIRARSLSDDLPEIVALIARALQQPDFPGDEIDKLRGEQLGAIAETNNDTRATADRIMRRLVYPEPNPLGRPVLGTAETAAALRRDDVVRYHRQVIRERGIVVALAGGLGAFSRAGDLFAAAFDSWPPADATPPVRDLSLTNAAPERAAESIAGKIQSDLVVGTSTISRRSPGYYALDVANLILGRLGLMGRLGAEVRDRQGLAYYATSQLEPRNDGSLWTARAGVDPANVERALEATRAEVRRLQEQLVSPDELADAQRALIGSLPLALETQDGVNAILLNIEEFALGLDFLDRYPEIIAGIDADAVREAARGLTVGRMAIGIAGPG